MIRSTRSARLARTMKLSPRSLVLALPLTSLVACGAPGIEATPFYGFSKFDGDFAISNGSVSATTSMESIGLDDREGLPGARVDFKWGAPHLSVQIAQTDTSGDGTTDTQLTQGGVTINAGAAVDSDLDLTYGNAVVTFDLVPTDLVEVGLGLGVAYTDIETNVQETGTANRVSTDEQVPVPVLALRAGVDLGPFAVDALVTGVDVSYSGDDLTFYEVDVRARWKAFEHGHLLVGWKRWSVDLDYEDGSDNVKLDVDADAPYVGIAISF